VPWRKLSIRNPECCSVCKNEFPSRTVLWCETSSKTLRCIPCHLDQSNILAKQVGIDGTAGSSAAKEYKKRKASYENKIRSEHPVLGEFIARFGDEPHTVKAWKKGQKGEQGVAGVIDELAVGKHWRVLHDRRIPGTKANIDHIVINSAGVWVVDAKNYRGLVRQEHSGGWLGSKEVHKLYVGDRDCTSLIGGVNWQVSLVNDAIKRQTAVTGVLAFYKAKWPWIDKPLEINGVVINSKGLKHILTQPGDLSPSTIDKYASLLAQNFPSA